MTRLALAASPPAAVDADVLVVGTVPLGDTPGHEPPCALLPAAPGPQGTGADGGPGPDALLAALVAVGATGRAGEVVLVPSPPGFAAPVVAGVGVGRPGPDGHDAESLRRAAGAAVRALAGRRRVALALPASEPGQAEAVMQGGLLGAYAFDRFRGATAAGRPEPVRTLAVVVDEPRRFRPAARHAETVAAAVALARDLVNTPPSALHPAELADAAVRAGDGLLEVRVWDEKALRRDRFGGILAVGQGSASPPRLVRLAYRHPQAVGHLALVGKGITFDSGGISIKPAAGMHAMKSDMGGAAAVLAAAVAVARLGLPVALTAWMACAENMPGGTAQRPGDVVTIRGGRTVEVLDTDAEGRLVLADALVRAAEEDPDVLVDAATLTGAQVVALGSRVSAVMSNDDGLRARVHDAAGRAGEAVWPMPLPDDLRASLDSPVADLANIGERQGGMLTAGLFLREFVPAGLPWAHLDIAGPAFNGGDAYGYTPKGGTGAAVRTFVRLAEDLAAGTLLPGRDAAG